MTRTADQILFEVDYWKAALEDLRALNDLVYEAARPIPEVPVAMLDLMLGGDQQAMIDRVSAATRDAMIAVQAMGEPIDRLIRLAEGRHAVLASEVGGAMSAPWFASLGKA